MTVGFSTWISSIWFIMGGERHQQSCSGPINLSSLWRKQQSTHPLGEEIKTRFLCLSLRLKSLELKYRSFALRTTGSFTRSLTGWFRPHVSGGVARGFQTVFSRHDARIPLISRPSWDSFFFSEVPFLSQSTKLQKSHLKLSNTTSIELSTQCHLMFQQRLFLILFFLKAGVVDVLLCFMTRCLFDNTLYTLRLANAWMLCIDWVLRGLWTVHTHHTNPCWRWKKPNRRESGGGRRMIVVEAYRRSWQSIHHR